MGSLGRYVSGVALVAAVLGFGLLALLADAVDAGPFLLVLDARVLLGLAVAIFAASFALYLRALRAEDPSRLVHAGPAVEALVPVYGDAGVMHRSVEGLLASEYDDLAVTILTEPDDPESTGRAEAFADAHGNVRSVVNRDRPGSKAGALNTGIARSDADVIAMFDADQEPDPKLIPHAVAALEDADAVRVRSLPRPTGGALESMAYYEYLLLFFLPQKLVRAVFGLAFAGTRSTLVVREVFDRVGTFEEGHLAEDLDFTHELHQAGVEIRELLYYPCFEQPAHTLRDWWGQRVRWMSGQVAVSRGHLRDWQDLLDPEFLGSLFTLVGTLVAGVLLATALPKLALSALAHPRSVGGGLVAIYAVALATRAVDDRTTALTGFGLAWLAIPVAVSLFGLVIVRVLVLSAFGRVGGWYRVEKSAEV